jgi:ribosomal protein S13
MRSLHRVIFVSVALFVLGLIGEGAIRVFDPKLAHELLHWLLALCTITGMGAYLSKLVISQLAAKTEHLKEEITAENEVHIRKVIAEESRTLHRAIVGEIEQYGDQRAIGAAIQNERRHLIEKRAGEATMEIRHSQQHNNVTPLLRRNG